MARSNGNGNSHGRYNQQSLMDQHSHDGSASASLSYVSETSSYNNNDPPPPPPPRKGNSVSSGPERTSASTSASASASNKDQSRSTNTSVSKSRRSGGGGGGADDDRRDRRRHPALDNMSMASSSGSESTGTGTYSQHSGIPPPPPPGAPPAKGKGSSSSNGDNSNTNTNTNTKQRSNTNANTGTGTSKTTPKSRRKDGLGRIAEGEVQIDKGGFPMSLEDDLDLDLDMDTDIFNFSKSSGGTAGGSGSGSGSRSKSKSTSRSKDGNGNGKGKGNRRVDLDDDVSNSHSSHLMHKAEEDAWTTTGNESRRSPTRSRGDDSVATEVLNYGGDGGNDGNGNDGNGIGNDNNSVTNAPSPFPTEDGSSVHSMPSIAISTTSENTGSVAARRRRKAQAAADAPTATATATAVPNPAPVSTPVAVEQEPPPPLELYSGSESDVSVGNDNDQESLKNTSSISINGRKSNSEKGKGTPKKKKKKGFGFSKVKKLIRMGANKSPEKNGRKSISPNKIRVSSSVDTEKAGRGRSNFLGRLSPARGRSATPEPERQVVKTTKRTGRSPSPFRIRNRSRSRSRARNGNEKKEKNKGKKETVPATKKASNSNNKRSSEIVVSKEKLAENERKLDESADGDVVQNTHRSQSQSQPQSQPDPMEEIAKAQREQKVNKEREVAAQLAAMTKRVNATRIQKEQQAHERQVAEEAQAAAAEQHHQEAQAQAYANQIAEEKRKEIRRQEKREEARLVKEARQLEITPGQGQDRIMHSGIMSGDDESDEVSEMTDPTYKSSHTYKDSEKEHKKDKGRKRMDAVPERNASPQSRSLSPESASASASANHSRDSRSPTSRTTASNSASRSRHTNHSRHTSRSKARSKHSSPDKSRSHHDQNQSKSDSKSKSRATNTSRSRAARDRARADVSAASGSRYSTTSRSISPTSNGNSRTSKSTHSRGKSRSPDSSRYHHSMSYQSGATSNAGESDWNPDAFTGEENFIASTSASTSLNNPTPRSADPFDDPFYEEHSDIEEEDGEMEEELEEMQEQFSFEYEKNTIDSNHNAKGRRRALTKAESGLTFSKEEEDHDGLSYSTPAADSEVTEVRNNVSPPHGRERERASSRTRRHTKSRLPFQANKSSISGARNAFLGIDENSGEVTLIKPAPSQVSASTSIVEKKSSGEMGSFSKRVMSKKNSYNNKSHQIPGVKMRSSPMPGMSSKGGYSMNNQVEEEEEAVVEKKPKEEMKKKNRGFLDDKDPYKPAASKSNSNSIGTSVRAKELYDRRYSPERERELERERERSISPSRTRTRERSVSPSRSASPSRGRKLSPEKSVYSTTSNHSGSGLYNSRSKSISRSPERKSPQRPAPTNSPSFILDRREKRKQREAELEAKAKSIRSQVKALERGRSDYYAIARSRGRRREQVFEASREFHSKSPTRPKTFSPDKLRRALGDEKNQSPTRALAESPVRSQHNPHDYESQRRRSPIREQDSWFEKPDYNTRSIRAISRDRARNNHTKKSFKAPAVFRTGSTRGVTFQAPDAYSNRTDPVIASVAHIQDPIQRAGAMILSAAAIPIQTEMRRYLAVKCREDRTWAITVIQAYFRRWKAELTRYKYLYCATRIQAAFRGWLLRDTMEDKHYCATQIQKVARGYLSTMRVYEDLYNITVVQSIARRNLAIARAELRYRNIITVQSLWRGKVCREEMKLLHWSAIKIQSHWRTYTARMNYQFDVVDIIIVQSIVRKKLAHNLAETLRLGRNHNAATTIQKYWRTYDCTMNYLHSVADVLIVQSVVRRWSAKRFVSQYRSDLHHEMALRIQMKVRSWVSKVRTIKERSARDIQKTWRGFWCYTDYVFTLADIIVVQRTVRAHQACTRVKAMTRERQDQRELAASIVIQKYWRGYSAQMNMLFTLVHIIIAQSIVRRRIAMINFKPRILEHRAAIKIQNFWRTFLRKRHFMQTYCATIIQSHARVFLARNLSEQMRCARRIQSWYRCRATRRGYLYYVSARRIQTLWRGYDARKLADEELWVREYAATTIQKTWRMFYQHSSYCIYMHETKAATNIQSHWRGFWDYSHFVIMRYEACKIQAAFRGYQQRKFLEHQDSAAVVIQAAARTLLAKKMCHMERLFSTMVYAAQLSLSQKMAARKIQEAFRQHYQRLKERRAALIIERFFIWVRSEVEREIERREKEKMRKRAKQRTKKKKEDDHLLEDVYKSVENTPGRGRTRSSKSLNNKPKLAGNRLRNSLKESVNASQSERQLRRPQLSVDLDDDSDISALTTPTATSPKFRIKKKGYQGSNMDDELEGAWLEAEQKQNKNATGYAREPGSGSRPKTRESQKENSSTNTPTLKLSARSLSRTRAEVRRARVS